MRMLREQCLSFIAMAVSLGMALGQGQSPDKTGLDELEAGTRKPGVRENWQKLTRGEVQASATDKEQMAAIENYARFYTFRFANKQFHTIAGNKNMRLLHEEFDREVKGLVSGKERTKECGRLFASEVIKRAKEVLEDPLSLVQVNMARALARCAELGNPELADALVEIIKNPNYNDGVKYYALRGLRDLLRVVPSHSPQFGNEREANTGAALIEFINRKANVVPRITPQDEMDGLCVLRREAIRALGQIQSPALPNKTYPALALVRVVANEEYMPELRMDERMEAAIGLARMRPGKDKDYQSAYAAQQIALMVADFTQFYNERQEHKRPSRVYAAQLGDTLDGLKNDTKDPYVLSLFDVGTPGQKLLTKMEKGEDGANQSDLLNLAEGKLPPMDRLFASVAESKARLPKKEKEKDKEPEKK
jgi:hypothetical protein